MSLQFVKGVAGSGKTSWLLDKIITDSLKETKKHFIVLVPEQYTMETQKQVALRHPNHGSFQIDVVSFERLAYRVFEELCATSYTILDDMGKSILLTKAARAHEKELDVFAKNLKRPGFISELKSILSELYQYGIGVEQLEDSLQIASKKPLLAAKMKDMATIYRSFTEILEEGTIPAEELLVKLCHILNESKLIKDSVIAIDGFTGFTPVQYQVVEKLLTQASKVYLSLTVDPQFSEKTEIPEYELFSLSVHTMVKVNELAVKNNIEVLPSISLENPNEKRFKHHEALSFLEKYALRFSNMRFLHSQEEFSVHVCQTPVDEVRFVCREICRLVNEKGYRYREIAIITGSLNDYIPDLKQELTKYQIPCFLDDKTSLMRNPLVEFIRSMLVLANGDFSYEKVFRHLKCGLFDIDRGDLDYLENYVIAMGIRSEKRWNREWNRSYKESGTIDFVHLNEVRVNVVEKLLAYKARIGKKGLTLKERIRAIVEFMMEAKLEEKLLDFSTWLEEIGEPFLASEYEQAYALVIELFDEIIGLLGEEEISLEELTILLDSGFAEIKVGFIPEGVDKITVGDMERTRLNGIRALFFIGVNEGKVPKAPGTGGIFTDYDKEQLSLMKIELSPTAKKNSFIQQFYLYLALTRASERLFITYAKTDALGKMQRPSVCLGDILRLFPKLQVKEEDDRQLDGKNWTDKNSALDFYIQGLSDVKDGKLDEDWLELFNHYRRHAGKKEQALSLLHATFGTYEKETLGKELARKLYGEVLSGNVSRLELQSACAYAQFLRYGLELEKRPEYRFQAVDIGNIFHMAIESVFNKAKEEKISLGSLSDEKRGELVHECVEQVIVNYGNKILDDSARNRWLGGRLERITDRTIWALSRQLAESGFIPDGIEVVFSADNSDALVLDLSEQEKMNLKGRIDRLDIKEDDNHVYVRIVDYKSGSTSFDLVSIYHGLQLQLVFYLDAAMENLSKRNPEKQIHPGGVLYYNIKEPLVDKTPKMSEEDIKAKLLEQMQMNGLMNVLAGEKEEKQIKNVPEKNLNELKSYVEDTVRHLGKQIIEGDIQVNPYKRGNKNPCTYCEYQSICRFDKKISGYRYRNLVSIPTEQIWEELSKKGEWADGKEVDPGTKAGD